MKKAMHFLFLLPLLVLFSTHQIFPQSSGYKIVGSIDIGEDGGWDYLSVESTMNRLYVSHSSRDNVIDLSNNSVVGEISNQHGVHGITYVQSLGKGYISNGRDSSVTVFDLKTLNVITTIKIPGKNPDAIIYEPFSKRIFTFNNGSASATAINPSTDKIIGTIKLDGAPEAGVSDLNGKVFVNLEDTNAINVFDPLTLKLIANWPLTPAATPTGLSFDRKNKRLFSSGRNKLLAVLDAENGKVITTLPIGGGVDGCAFDPQSKLIFTSNGEGTITVIKEKSPDQYEVLDNIPTIKGARTIALDEATHKVYTSASLDKPENKKSFGVLILDSK